jgi:hypothetical protein
LKDSYPDRKEKTFTLGSYYFGDKDCPDTKQAEDSENVTENSEPSLRLYGYRFCCQVPKYAELIDEIGYDDGAKMYKIVVNR